MKSVEEFEKIMGKNFESIEQGQLESERKKLEESEAFADATIELLTLSMKDFSEYGSKEVTIRQSIFGEYNTNLGKKEERSFIRVNQNGASIHLKYSYDKKYNPFQFLLDQTMVNKILKPYYVSITYERGREYEPGQLIIFYDHAQKVKDQVQSTLEEERKKKL